MHDLAVAASNERISNRWEIFQDSILFGILLCRVITNGCIFDADFETVQTHYGNLYNAFIDEYLPVELRTRRAGTALFARLKNLKTLNRAKSFSHFTVLWERFLRTVGHTILLKPLFRTSHLSLTEADILIILNTDRFDLVFAPSVPIRMRSNAWSDIEKQCLMGAIVGKFLFTGSLSSPRSRKRRSDNKPKEKTWSTVLRLFNYFKVEEDIAAPVRHQSAIERQFKDMKQKQREMLASYFIAFHLKRNTL